MQRIIFGKNMYDIFVEFYPSKSISCMVQCNSSTWCMGMCFCTSPVNGSAFLFAFCRTIWYNSERMKFREEEQHMVRVVKKDHTKEPFNIQKVVIAVNKSANRVLYNFTEDELKSICNHVEGYIRDHHMIRDSDLGKCTNIVRVCALESVRPGGCQKLSRLPQL